MSHTPGRWSATIDKVRGQCSVETKETGHKNVVEWVDGATFEETAANALLIAAAPDLLEALKKLIWLETTQGVEVEEMEAAIEAACIAVRKASRPPIDA